MNQLNIDLGLPNHETELNDAEEYIKKLKIRYTKHEKDNVLNREQYIAMYEDIVRGLDYMGGLSEPAFETYDIIKDTYFKQYRHAPEMAKFLWRKHYAKVHQPYNILKNRLFRMIEDIMELYKTVNDCAPPEYF